MSLETQLRCCKPFDESFFETNMTRSIDGFTSFDVFLLLFLKQQNVLVDV